MSWVFERVQDAVTDRPSLRVDVDPDTTISAMLRGVGFARWNGAFNRLRGRRRAVIVMYHSFSPGGKAAIAPDTLRWHLDLIRDAYHVVPLERLVSALANGESTDGLAAVTVDDAYEDFFTVAYPMLCELRLPATLFVPTGLIGGQSDWYDERRTPLKIASAALLRELDPHVVKLGSHTVHHHALAGLHPATVEKELSRSKRDLESIVNGPVTLFAYPFGGHDSYTTETVRALKNVGFLAGVTTRWETYSSRRELMTLPRISFRETDTAATVQAKLGGDFDWLCGRQLASRFLRGALNRSL
jgi:peptidoglycan/xylan/chitin deacetylase (PgdA/CDA1 family)